MPVPNFKRTGHSQSAEQKRPTPTGPGPSKRDGTENTDAGSTAVQRPSWQGPGTVVTSE